MIFKDKNNQRIYYIYVLFISIILYYIFLFVFSLINNSIILNLVFSLVFSLSIVIIVNKIFLPNIRKLSYFTKKDEYKDRKKRKRIFKPIKNYLLKSAQKTLNSHSRKNEIKSFLNVFKEFIDHKKNLKPNKYQKIQDILIEMLDRKHPLEYIVLSSQEDLLRDVFKLMMNEILNKNTKNLHKKWKKEGVIPSMEEIFDNAPNIQLSNNIFSTKKKFSSLIKRFEKSKIFKMLNLKIDKSDFEEKFQSLFSSNELEKREEHFFEDAIKSYQKLYSTYELIEYYLGYLLDIEDTDFNPFEFKSISFRRKRELINKFREKIKEDNNWKIFYEYGVGKKRKMRNLDAHEEILYENDQIKGWFKGSDFNIVDFNENRILLILLLWKVYEILGISLKNNYIDKLLKF